MILVNIWMRWIYLKQTIPNIEPGHIVTVVENRDLLQA